MWAYIGCVKWLFLADEWQSLTVCSINSTIQQKVNTRLWQYCLLLSLEEQLFLPSMLAVQATLLRWQSKFLQRYLQITPSLLTHTEGKLVEILLSVMKHYCYITIFLMLVLVSVILSYYTCMMLKCCHSIPTINRNLGLFLSLYEFESGFFWLKCFSDSLYAKTVHMKFAFFKQMFPLMTEFMSLWSNRDYHKVASSTVSCQDRLV